jgi:PAS domain S-box-containing protein
MTFRTMNCDATVTQSAAPSKSESLGDRDLVALTDLAPVMLIQCDAAARLRYVNRACARQFQIEPSNVVSCSLEAFLGETTYRQARPHVDAALSGSRVEFEIDVALPSCGPQRIRAVLEPQRDAAGAVVGFVGALDNLTAQFQSQTNSQRSEQRYQAFISVLPHMVWAMRPDHTIEFQNERCSNYVGRTVAEVNRLGWLSLVHPDDQAAMRSHIQGPLERGEPHHASYRLRRFDGEYRWVECFVYPLKNDAGEVELWLGTTTDVHEQKLNERQLRESEARFRQLADALPQIIWMTDAQGKLDFHNARWYEYTGIAPNGASQEVNNRFLHPDDEAKIQADWQAAFATGRSFEHEARIRHGSSGTYRWFLCRAVPVFDESGRVARWFGTSTDIDDQKKIEQQLRDADRSLRELNATLEARVVERTAAAEERAQALIVSERELRRQTLVLRSILESMGDAVIVADKDGRIVLGNRAARSHYEIEPGRSIAGLTSELSRLFHADGTTPYRLEELPLVRALGGQSCDDVEVVVRSTRPEGDLTVSVSGRPMLSDDGGVEGGVIVMRDVTTRKQMIEQLRESEERFRKSFEFAAIGKAIVGLDGKWLEVNHSLCELLGYSEKELLAKNFQSLTHPDDLDEDLVLTRRLSAGEIRNYQMEKRYVRRDGQVINTLLSVSLVRDGGGRPLYFISQIHNLTELKRAEDERRRAADRTRFVEQTISAREAEQRRLARDLHDGVGQSLTSLRLGLRALEEAIDLEHARRSAAELRRIAVATLEEIRTLTKSLRPSVLDDMGLVPAITRLITDLRLVNPLRVEFRTAQVEGRRFTEVVETALFRIAQEALTNIVRHASAQEATIDLSCDGTILQLQVVDDGVGFNAAESRANQFGITGMRERAALLGGELFIYSTPGSGTRILVRISVDPSVGRESAA